MKRAFELSALVPLYVYVLNNIDNIKRNIDLEFTIGSSTIVYQITKNDEIQLITGWVGQRKGNSKKKFK